MKKTLKIELPDRETIVAGLAPRDVHPPLVNAERAAAEADLALDRARRALADRERLLVDLPMRVQRGESKASALTEALRERDAAALGIAAASRSLDVARERVTTEEKNAKLAADREFARRVEQLEKAAAEIAPVLDDIKDLAGALAATRGPGAILGSVDWPNSPRTDANMRAFAMSSSSAAGPLAWSTKP